MSQSSILTLVFKLVQSAQQRWLRIQKFDRLTQIIEGVKFSDGMKVEALSDRTHQPDAA